MPHVITQACCVDASCVHACPVNCIHPAPDEPEFATAEMLYIDPDTCIDCGACVGACPVSAIVPHTRLPDDQQDFLNLNKALHDPERTYPPQARVPTIIRLSPTRTTLRVAIVGAGPAALYAADELLKQPGITVTVFDRLPVPHGLARHGVAPDHPATRSVSKLFDTIAEQPCFNYQLGVHIGDDITAPELAAHHHAVIYATGASTDRRLDLPGIDLPGSTSATELVAWYNGHPDHTDTRVPLDHERAVIIGNGNVALDVARILLTAPDLLAGTDIAPYALTALQDSTVREVVILGRRGPADAAFTLPELIGLAARDDIDLVVDAPDGIDIDAATDRQSRLTLTHLDHIARRTPRPELPRIVLRFQTAPVAILGQDKVEKITITRTDLAYDDSGRTRAVGRPDSEETLETGLVLRSIGYRGVPVPGVPFDDATGTIPHTEGRVLTDPDGDQVNGTYVVGWIKRGPSGFLGSNKTCARETINSLLADANNGHLPTPRPPQHFTDLLARRQRGQRH